MERANRERASRVCVGMITGAHGVRGLVKVKPFTADPAAVAAYGPVTDEAGRRTFTLELLSPHKDQWLARLEGIADRDSAAALHGTRLYVDRAVLPEPEGEDEFYHADLLGLAAERPDGTPLGRVAAIHDFGAGDMIELRLETGRTVMLPFTRQVVPVVDLAGGRLVVEPPEGLLEPAGAPPAPEDEAAAE